MSTEGEASPVQGDVRWVSVTERLPEYTRTMYLTFTPSNLPETRYRVQRLYVYDSGHRFSGKVTHWQPLPEPPN